MDETEKIERLLGDDQILAEISKKAFENIYLGAIILIKEEFKNENLENLKNFCKLHTILLNKIMANLRGMMLATCVSEDIPEEEKNKFIDEIHEAEKEYIMDRTFEVDLIWE